MIDPGLRLLQEAQFYTHLSIYHYTRSSHMQSHPVNPPSVQSLLI